jgi:hypothetical protein
VCDDDLDAPAVGLRLDSGLGLIPRNDGDKALLYIHSVALCPGNTEEKADILALMGYAYAKFRSVGRMC